MADEMDQAATGIIAAFGGIRPMATKLGVPVSTVQGWKQRDTIPAGRMAEIRRVASENNIQMPAAGEPIIEATAIKLPDSRDSEPKERSETGSKTEKKAPETKAPAPVKSGKTSGIAVLALLVSIGAAGWLWWSTEGPGAGHGENARISALEGRIARLADTTGDPGKADREALSKQVLMLRGEIETLSNPDQNTALDPIKVEIAKLRAQVAQSGEVNGSAVDPLLTQRLSDMDARILKIEQMAPENSQVGADAIADLGRKFVTLDERLAGLQSEGARQEAAAIDAISLTLAASQLRRDIDRGEPYRDALTTLESISRDDVELEAVVKRLSLDADAGVASLEELVFSFDATAVAILDNAPEDAESTIVDQILDRARRVVRVRRVGTDLPPDSIDGRLSRVEFRLREGDVAGAVAILDLLEGGAAEAARSWVVRAKSYVEIGAALETIEAQALARLRTAGGS